MFEINAEKIVEIDAGIMVEINAEKIVEIDAGKMVEMLENGCIIKVRRRLATLTPPLLSVTPHSVAPTQSPSTPTQSTVRQPKHHHRDFLPKKPLHFFRMVHGQICSILKDISSQTSEDISH